MRARIEDDADGADRGQSGQHDLAELDAREAGGIALGHLLVGLVGVGAAAKALPDLAFEGEALSFSLDRGSRILLATSVGGTIGGCRHCTGSPPSNADTPPCLVFEHALAVHVRAAAGRAPDGLVLVLFRQIVEEVARHEIVIEERLVAVRIGFNELIGQRVDQHTADRDRAVARPDPHHPAEIFQIFVGQRAAAVDCGDLGSQSLQLPPLLAFG